MIKRTAAAVAFLALAWTIVNVRVRGAYPDMTCVPKLLYCVNDEDRDEAAGFHTFSPPLHVRWCRCFFQRSDP